MTENEALKYMKLFRDEWDRNSKTKNEEALDVAIQALEEIPRYRDLGTVDELAEMQVQYHYLSRKIKEYKAIGTIEEFKALKHFESNYEHNLKVEYNKAIDEFAEKVVAELESRKELLNMAKISTTHKNVGQNAYNIAIDIVKAGGINE